VRANALRSAFVRQPPASTIARAAIAIVVVVMAARVWPLLHRAIDVDEFEHAHAAWCVANGLVPYRDFFEHHTPALYFAFAPLFAAAPVDRDAGAALRVLLQCRAAMFALTIAAIALTYRLARIDGDRVTAALAVVLLATSEQFLNSMMEFRPDVFAVAGTLLALMCAVAAARRRDSHAAIALAFVSGAAFALALLSTQKAAFAAPGLLVGLAASRRRAAIAAWAAGVVVPVASTLAWFAAHDALGPFVFWNVVMNVRLNADRFATLPVLVRHAAHHPALYLFGLCGLVAALRRRTAGPATRAVATGAASLLAGAFVIGKPYDQYFALMLPLLAVAGAHWMRDALRTRPRWSAASAARAFVWTAAIAGSAAFVLIIRPLGTLPNAVMAACFSAAALLAAAAFEGWERRPVGSAAAGLLAMVALLTGNLIREFDGNAQQKADLQWVTTHTRPSDTVLSGYQSVAAFRPHAWFYFFLTGPFPTSEDYAALLASLQSGRIRPRLIVFNATLTTAPRPVLDYIHAHYRRVRGDLWERDD
jgi:dolichyl-phosphate-mannose-protein mannosyltransferase